MGGLTGYNQISDPPPPSKEDGVYDSMEDIYKELEYDRKNEEIIRNLKAERLKNTKKK